MKRKVLALTLIAAAASVASSNIAKAASATANATATIEAPISIEKGFLAAGEVGDLAFGAIVAGDQESSVTVDIYNVRSLDSGNAELVNSDHARGVFSINGAPGATYSATLPSSAITITSGANSMTVDNFTRSTGTYLSTSGIGREYVGATLHVGANQPTGSYSGTFEVSVAYN